MQSVASNVVLNSKHPFKVFAHLGHVEAVCARALAVSETHALRCLRASAAPALDSLATLERSAGYRSLFLNIKQFGSRLHAFLEAAARASHDLHSDKAKAEVRTV